MPELGRTLPRLWSPRGLPFAALVAITTTRSARSTNQATIDAAENTARALDAAREERIWEKRAEVYLDAMRLVRHRQEARENTTRTLRYDDETEERIRLRWVSRAD